MAQSIGIDLGTTNTNVYLKGRGIIFSERTLIAFDSQHNEILAIGNEAKEMIGKFPPNIEPVKPINDGIIYNCKIIEDYLSFFINKVCGILQIIKPNFLIGIPSSSSSIEKRAIISTTKNSGAKNTYLFKEPLLAAIGLDLPVDKPEGNLLVNIGGGCTDIAVISLGGIVVSSCLRVGGDKIDSAISSFIKRKYNLLIGEQTAEEIKIKIGSAYPQKKEEKISIKGRNLLSGLPSSLNITSSEVREAMISPLTEIVEGIRKVISCTSPELLVDIMENGIYLTGGVSKLKGLDLLFQKTLNLSVNLTDEPELSTIRGLGKILEDTKHWRKILSC